MDKKLLKQAAAIFNSGDRKGAEELFFQIIRDEPDNADAWYGLALCTQEEEERISRLEKCLAIYPNHPKARKVLDMIQAKQNAQINAVLVTPVHESTENNRQPLDNSVTQQKFTKTSRSFSPHWIYSPIIILLICFSIWQYIRLDRLEKAFVEFVDATNSDIRTFARKLDYVTPLAENANMYAHSHPFSDERLKTDIVAIDDPIAKIMQLRGVYFHWNTASYPQMGFGDELQVGVIAQEVERVFPELVTTDPNGYKQVDYEKLSAVLIEAVKEQQNEIETLQNRVDQIEGK